MKRWQALTFLGGVGVLAALLIGAVIAQLTNQPNLLVPFCGVFLLLGAFVAIELLLKPGFWQEKLGLDRMKEREMAEEGPPTPIAPDGTPVRAKKIRRRDRFNDGSP